MASKPIQMEPAYKSKLEEKVAKQFKTAGVVFGYERKVLRFTIPERIARYNPDFDFDADPTIIIEAKGRFGHKFGNGADVRHRLILAKEQNPALDIRIVFENANLKIGKGSQTTYGKWATDHGFQWADKGVVPYAWIAELKGKRKKR